MKMNSKFKVFSVLAAIAFIPVACSEDVDIYEGNGAPYETNFAYIYQPSETFATLDYKANGNAINSFSDLLTLMPVRLTKPAPADMTVDIAIDESLVEEYNAAKGTSYVFLTGASVTNGSISIKQGAYSSADSVRVALDPSHAGFMTGASDYILPVVINSTSAGKQVTVSKSSRIFLTFNANYIQNYVKAVNQSVYIDTDVESWKEDFKEVTLEGIAVSSYAPFENISVSLEIDGSLTDAYNEANGSECVFMSDAVLGSSSVNISPDGTAANVVLKTGDLSLIEEEGTYLVPIRIKVSGASAELAEDGEIAYVEISASKPEILRVDEPVGSPYVYTDAMDAYSSDYDNWAYDGVTGDDYYQFYPDYYMHVDLGETITLQSFGFKAYDSWCYPEELQLEVSTDDENWTDYGTAEGDYGQINYYQLTKPATARYLRLTVLKVGPYGTYLRGLKLYVK